MINSTLPPLSARGERARDVFYAFLALASVLAMLDLFGVIEGQQGVWRWVGAGSAAGWIVGAATWAVAEYRRRHSR